ncbi:hypothetical protein ACE0DR_11580 [Azotobacter sp. CWF10]
MLDIAEGAALVKTGEGTSDLGYYQALDVTNAGQVTVESGTLQVQNLSNSGSVSVAAGAALTLGYSGGASRFAAGSTLTVDGLLEVAGGAVELEAGVLTDVERVSVSSGTLSLASVASVNELTLTTGELGGAGQVDVAESLNWTGGTLSGELTVRSGASASLGYADNGYGSGTLTGAMEVAGSAVLQENSTFYLGSSTWDGERYVDDAGELKVLSGGRLELQGEGDLYGSTSGAEGAPRSVLDIAEGAALVKTGEGTSDLGYYQALDVTNAGQVTVESGTLQVQNLSNSGSVSVAAGAALTLGYSGGASRFAAGSTLTVDGLLEVAGGAVELEAGVLTNAERLSVASGTLSLASAASVSELTLSSGELGGAGRVDVVESLDWTGGTLSGELTVRSGASASLGYADNGYGSGTLTGAMEVAGSAVLQENSTFYLGSSTWDGERYVDDAGELKVLSGGRLELQGEGDLYGSTSGAEGAPRSVLDIAEGAALVKTGEGTSDLGYYQALDVTNAGQVTVESGTLQVQNLSNSGSVSVAAGAALTLGYSGGASRFAAGSTLTVDGLLEVAGGAVELEAGVLTDAERVSVSSGTLSLASVASVNELTLTTGELGGAGQVDVAESLNWTGGTLSGELTVRSGASASLGYADNGYGSGTLTGAMEVAGSAVLQENSTFYLGSSTWDGERYVDDAGELKVLSGGRLELQGEGDLYGSTSGAEGAPRSVLDIAEGAALAKTGEGTSTLYSSALDVTNAGQVTVENGTLRLQNFSNSGAVSVAADAALTLGYSGGVSRFAAGSTLTVDGLLEVAGGAVELEAGVLTDAERVSVASGTLSLASAASVNELTVTSGELGGAGRVDVAESLNWMGGTLSGELTVRSGASASLGYADNGYGSGTLTGAMEVAGSAVLQENSTFYLGSSTWDGERYVDDAGELKVLSGGRLELQGEGDLYGSTSGAEGRRARCSTSPRAPRWSRPEKVRVQLEQISKL